MFYKDFTLKAQLDNFDEIEGKLKRLNAVLIGVDNQKDTYFATSKGKLKLREGNIEFLITHYQRVVENGMERSEVFRYEQNPSEEAINRLFSEHEVLGITKKERKIYWIDNIKIHLDTLEDKSKFIEIEAIDKDNRFTELYLQSQCKQLVDYLEIPSKNFVKTGYFQ